MTELVGVQKKQRALKRFSGRVGPDYQRQA